MRTTVQALDLPEGWALWQLRAIDVHTAQIAVLRFFCLYDLVAFAGGQEEVGFETVLTGI
jgi:hypothetical protein